jgi:hypothetical protein
VEEPVSDEEITIRVAGFGGLLDEANRRLRSVRTCDCASLFEKLHPASLNRQFSKITTQLFKGVESVVLPFLPLRDRRRIYAGNSAGGGRAAR